MAKTVAAFDSGTSDAFSEGTWGYFWQATGLGAGVALGRLNGLEPLGDSSGMQAKFKSGEALGFGVWYQETAQQTLAVDAAHATLSRTDEMVLRFDWVANDVTPMILKGTAGVGPATLESTIGAQFDVWLAEVTVPPAAVTIRAQDVVDKRVPVSKLAAMAYVELKYHGPTLVAGTGYRVAVAADGTLVAIRPSGVVDQLSREPRWHRHWLGGA